MAPDFRPHPPRCASLPYAAASLSGGCGGRWHKRRRCIRPSPVKDRRICCWSWFSHLSGISLFSWDVRSAPEPILKPLLANGWGVTASFRRTAEDKRNSPLRIPWALCADVHTSQIVCRSLCSYKGLSATEFLFPSIMQLEGRDEPTPNVFKFARKSLGHHRHGRSQSQRATAAETSGKPSSPSLPAERRQPRPRYIVLNSARCCKHNVRSCWPSCTN